MAIGDPILTRSGKVYFEGDYTCPESVRGNIVRIISREEMKEAKPHFDSCKDLDEYIPVKDDRSTEGGYNGYADLMTREEFDNEDF